jgi:ATP-dependent helicase/nuclease subunit A
MTTDRHTARERLLYELPSNVVVSAGAGTGKTHRLTGLYLHLVAGLTDLGRALSPDSIVATTFTREAASEMRARIEARLRRLVETELASLHDDPAAGAWARELSETCARRASSPPSREVWRAALDRLPRGTITTFHAWAGDLVRAYPIEARVPPTFTLIEPEEADEVVLSALSEVLARWVEDDATIATPGVEAPPITRRGAARQLLATGHDRLEEAVLRALMRAAEDGLELGRMPLADDDRGVQSARARRGALLAALERALDEKPKADVGLRDRLAELRAVAAMIPDDGRYDAVRVARFGELVVEIHNALRFPSSVKEILAPMPGTNTDKAERIADDPSACRAAIALDAASRVLLAEVAARVDTEKRRMRALDFGDVMRKARDLLLHHPDVQAEVAEGVSALLVDEFQDTNALQRDLVYLVWQTPEAIAKRQPGQRPQPSTLRPRGLFLVGDRKQSIYGFRGADVAVFQQMAVELAGEDSI